MTRSAAPLSIFLTVFAVLLPAPAISQVEGAAIDGIDPFPLHTPEAQIRMAVQSLPEALRDGATVLGYREVGGVPVELRRGDGEFVCLLSPPGVWAVESACYHASMEPFMARGRELAREGVPDAERVATRNREAADGTIPLPTGPAALHVTLAPVESVDPETGAFSDSYTRYVIYVPFMTGADIGLPERPDGNAPWLMEPGSPRAHIMFAPSMAIPESLRAAMARGR